MCQTFFNDIFEKLNCTKDVRKVLGFAEFIASIELVPVSIDCIISAILYYYQDEKPDDIITQIFPAKDYYAELKKENAETSLISFSNFSQESFSTSAPYIPDITDDVLDFFEYLTEEYTDTINVTDLFFEISSFCSTNQFKKEPILINNNNSENFRKLQSVLKKSVDFRHVYAKKSDVAFGSDLTYQAYENKFDPIIGRASELQHILRILSKRFKNNPLLVGEPGVGKTHIVEALANLFVSGNVPERFQGRKIIQLNIAEIISGTKYRGDLEENLQTFVEGTQDIKAIVFIDEIHMLFKGQELGISSFLKPYLLNPNYSVIGVTTPKEYSLFEKDPAFKRRFDVVKVDEPSIDEARGILKGLKENYEEFHKVFISDEVIEAVLNLSARYIQSTKLPDKALDILDEACAQLEISSTLRQTLSEEDIYAIVTEKTHIPVSNLRNLDTTILLKLEDLLNQKVVGQAQAITAIVKALKRSKIDLQDATKPLASFLFAGTTGVGKTETAKVLANEYFGNNALIRFDMSEYQTKETVHKLTGASPGYVGYNEGGQLTNAVRNTPYCVVLFDEIEKAHPDVLNILLQILDDGRLTDSFGTTTDFKNTIIILTTNIGAEAAQKKPLGFGESDELSNNNSTFLSELKKALRPELINRLSQIVVYNELTKTDCEKIAKIYFEDLKEKLQNKGITLRTSSILTQKLVEAGYNRTYGARELKRTFEKLVLDPITDFILSNPNVQSISIDSSFSIKCTKKRPIR